LKTFFQEAVPEEDAVPGAVIAIQSFGDFLGFNPHLHVLASDGCFYGNGNVFCGPRIQPGDQQAMENLARYIIRASLPARACMPLQTSDTEIYR